MPLAHEVDHYWTTSPIVQYHNRHINEDICKILNVDKRIHSHVYGLIASDESLNLTEEKCLRRTKTLTEKTHRTLPKKTILALLSVSIYSVRNLVSILTKTFLNRVTFADEIFTLECLIVQWY